MSVHRGGAAVATKALQVLIGPGTAFVASATAGRDGEADPQG